MRQPFRQAGRAAACIRRLERQLDPLRALASGHGESPLLRQDERLGGIVNSITPFDALSSVLGRLGAKPDADAATPRLYRRGLGAAVADHFPASLPEHETAARSIAKLARPLPAVAEYRAQASAVKVQPQGIGLGIPFPGDRMSADLPPAAPHFIGAPRGQQDLEAGPLNRPHQRIGGNEFAPQTRFQPEITPQPQPGILTAQQAAAILAGRMRTAATRNAYRTPIRIVNHSDAPNESRTALTSGQQNEPAVMFAKSPAGGMLTAATRNTDRAPIRIVNHSDAPNESPMLAKSPAGRTSEPHVSIPRRAASPSIGSPARGLVRLAAMATESLDQTDPDLPAARPGSRSTQAASSTGNPAAPPDLRLDLELERILRDEAARYGIGSEGIVG